MNDTRDKASLAGDLGDLLASFTRPNLTIAQAEELLSHVDHERPQLVEKLLSWLEREGAAGSPPTSAAGRPAMLHDVALVLLGFLGDRAIVPRLCKLLRAAGASDEFKLKLIGVIHDLEPQQDSRLLLDHLRYPGKAMLQSHRKHLQRLSSPLERSFWLELMAQDMSADARISFARSSAEADDPAAVPVLVCMCYDPDAQVALSAIDAVERYKDARALPALHELAAHHPDERVRTEALKAADRLGVRVPLSPQVEPAQPDPLLASYLTAVDDTGERAAILVRHLATPADVVSLAEPDEAASASSSFLRLVQVSFNDRTGIEQCFGVDLHEHDLEEVLCELDGRGLAPVQVPYHQALAQIEDACRWTWRAGRLLPLSFVAWREWIRDPDRLAQADTGQAAHAHLVSSVSSGG